jgi:hypothetical protein
MPEDKYARVRVDSTTFVGTHNKTSRTLTSKVRLLRPKSRGTQALRYCSPPLPVKNRCCTEGIFNLYEAYNSWTLQC